MLEAHQATVSSCTASVCIWLNKSRAAVHCPAFSQALIAALKTMVSATTWSLRMSPRRLKATCGRSTMRSQGEKRGDLAVSSINTDLAGHLTCGTCEDSEDFKKCQFFHPPPIPENRDESRCNANGCWHPEDPEGEIKGSSHFQQHKLQFEEWEKKRPQPRLSQQLVNSNP